MGNIQTLIFEEQKLHTERMARTYRLMRKVFISQLAILATGGVILGFYILYASLIFKSQLRGEEILSTLCPQCSLNNFTLICHNCSKILSCDQCAKEGKIKKCPCCKTTFVGEEPIKIFMN